MTAEQRLAFTDFRALVAPLRLRVKADSEGFPIAPGWYGQLERHDASQVTIYSQTMRMLAKLLRIQGVRRHQIGDREFVCFCPWTTCTTEPNWRRWRGSCVSGYGGGCPSARN